MENIIEIVDLVYEYRKNEEEKVKALKEVSLNVKKGEFVVVIGHNGSGKSTMAKHMNALLLPSGGKVYVNGLNTQNESNTWDIRQTAGMVFQNPDNQIVATIVEEDVAFGLENLGVPSKEIRNRVDEALNTVGMMEFRKKGPHLLSGGQKQRIAIAGVIAMKPKCIVLDEPTAMLDPSGRKEVIETITRLNKEENITIVHITHFMDEAVNADRVVVMEGGNIVLEGTPKDVFYKVKTLKQLGLDVPQVTELAYEIEKAGIPMSKNILTVEDMIGALNRVNRDESKIDESIDKVELELNKRCMESSSDAIAIDIERLTHIYNENSPFETKALNEIDIKIKKGEFIGLIGHTGSGKSTLTQHLNGLLKPSGGKITVNGFDITKKGVKLKEIRKKVGLVFQYPEHQLFEETVHKDVAFGPINLGLEEKEIDQRVREAIELVGLNYEEIKDRSPFELSGGQRRRVAIAGVVAMKPEVLILDEPTAGLDPKSRDDILMQMKRLHEKHEMTIILVSHSMEDVAKLVDQIIVMHKGEVALKGKPKDVFKNAEFLESIGLGVPQVTYLMKKLKKIGKPVRDDVFTIQEAKNEILRYIRGN